MRDNLSRLEEILENISNGEVPASEPHWHVNDHISESYMEQLILLTEKLINDRLSKRHRERQ